MRSSVPQTYHLHPSYEEQNILYNTNYMVNYA